jgi:hypothetical protein
MAHRSAAEHHGKGDHAKGKEHANTARQHSQTANQHGDQAQAGRGDPAGAGGNAGKGAAAREPVGRPAIIPARLNLAPLAVTYLPEAF